MFIQNHRKGRVCTCAATNVSNPGTDLKMATRREGERGKKRVGKQKKWKKETRLFCSSNTVVVCSDRPGISSFFARGP